MGQAERILQKLKKFVANMYHVVVVVLINYSFPTLSYHASLLIQVSSFILHSVILIFAL